MYFRLVLSPRRQHMNKKILAFLICSILLLTITFIVVVNQKMGKKETTPRITDVIYVNKDNTVGPWSGTLSRPYQHINDAVLNSKPGDTIYVNEGTYHEDITIDKTITLVGEDKSNTIIDGMYNDTILYVTEDNVNILNFTIRNSGGCKDNAGVKLISDNNQVTDCIIYRTKTGIYLDDSDDNEISNCLFHTNGEGIFLETSSNCEIKDCEFCHNAIGINLQSSTKNSIQYCYASTGGIGVFIIDSQNNDISHCAICDNNDNQGGIFIIDSSSMVIENCHIAHNGFGVNIAHSTDILVKRCDLYWNTHFAIKIHGCSNDISVSNCEITDNFRYGIHIEDNSHAIATENNIHSNTLQGVFCEKSKCKARNNWWGSPFGPSFTELGLGDRITLKNMMVKFIPWSRRAFENTGADWERENHCTVLDLPTGRFTPIEIPGDDTDNDDAPDWWEEKWGYNPSVWNDHLNLDPDEDALNNIEECFTDQWGSNPNKKDIFLEYDWVASLYPNSPSKKLSAESKEKLIAVFEKHNIALHIDDGNLGENGGEEIPYISNFSFADLRDLYWDYFLHNDLNNPRKGIFHYCLVCDYGPGVGFAFVGWDHLDSFDISVRMQEINQPDHKRQCLISGGGLHELGHTLGLFVDDHGGNDNIGVTKPLTLQWWKYRSYKSCMNYLHTYRILDYSDGSHGWGDFDDWDALDFSFFKNSHFEWPKNGLFV